MPEVDLMAICGGGNERKITCESLAEDDKASEDEVQEQEPDDQPEQAPLSFWLSKEAELDWLNRNAFIERKDSGRSNTNSHSGNLNPNLNATISQRYFSKSRASIIGLPKQQKTNYADHNFRRHNRPASVRLFPKRSESGSGKSTDSFTEPSSPKVSCIGRVRSKSHHGRRMRNLRNQPEPAITKTRSVRKAKTGFWTNIRSIFRSRGHKPEEKTVDKPKESPTLKKSRSVRKHEFYSTPSETPSEPPSLGALTRFSSGRRSDSWAGDLDFDGTKSERSVRGSIWGRRNAGRLHDVLVVGGRWESVGPISV
ncbi:hypothetical protein Nepgr_030563 [Nepenthes gracilis]|uniref:Uncharacterized protein n=1 Tax=Nepenthes gracilis TaxID=150966 RepID=A0AAD3TFJ8_NEPGR|nr:hypothetical protein Nepgr_030563 [Nepenthes gracilis]